MLTLYNGEGILYSEYNVYLTFPDGDGVEIQNIIDSAYLGTGQGDESIFRI